MAGIERINIISSWHNSRIEMARDLAPAANLLYRAIFNNIGMPIAEGYDLITCSRDEAAAIYDWKDGIDVILKTDNGIRLTLQEKYLTFNQDTITFEEEKNSGAKGAWYYCAAQYYFVGYARGYYDGRLSFDSWIMTDLPAIHRKSATGNIPWKFKRNQKPGFRQQFRYVYFNELPAECVIASGN